MGMDKVPTFDASTAGVDECAEWLAEDDGWIRHVQPFDYHGKDEELSAWVAEMGFSHVATEGGKITYWTHPNHWPVMGVRAPGRPITIDGAAAALPKGWTWERTDAGDGMTWYAYPPGWDGQEYPTIKDTGDEKLDRFRLAILARQASK